MHGQPENIIMQSFQTSLILDKINRSRNQFLAGINVTYVDCRILFGKSKSILGLMVLCYIG